VQHYPCALRSMKYLALTAAASALVTAGFAISYVKPAHAEFEIQEAGVEKGEKEFEYRGAAHWGFPKQEQENATDSEEEGAAEDDEEEEGPLRQSHDFEFQYGLTNRWLFSTTLTADEPLDQDFNVSAVELGLQYEFMKRNGDGIALAVQSEYEFATRGGEADEFGFGPIVELASGKLLITLNPVFNTQVGENRDQDGLGFEYGWRAEYDFAKHWGIGVEMFGEIEDLANAGSFNDQNHSIGPTLFWNPGGGDEDEGEEAGGDDDEKAGGPPDMELSFNVGFQFGLTDVTSDGAVKFQGSLAW
jgi:hypothetical protein